MFNLSLRMLVKEIRGHYVMSVIWNVFVKVLKFRYFEWKQDNNKNQQTF